MSKNTKQKKGNCFSTADKDDPSVEASSTTYLPRLRTRKTPLQSCALLQASACRDRKKHTKRKKMWHPNNTPEIYGWFVGSMCIRSNNISICCSIHDITYCINSIGYSIYDMTYLLLYVKQIIWLRLRSFYIDCLWNNNLHSRICIVALFPWYRR